MNPETMNVESETQTILRSKNPHPQVAEKEKTSACRTLQCLTENAVANPKRKPRRSDLQYQKQTESQPAAQCLTKFRRTMSTCRAEPDSKPTGKKHELVCLFC